MTAEVTSNHCLWVWVDSSGIRCSLEKPDYEKGLRQYIPVADVRTWQHGEMDDPMKLAESVLDRRNADPDDDLAVLARQLIRRAEWAQKYRRLVEALATSLEVNSALGLEELAREIPAAIQKLRDARDEACGKLSAMHESALVYRDGLTESGDLDD